MSAKRNLREHLRQYGYENAPGLTVIAKECRSRNIEFYTELAAKERPALFFREKDNEWLVTMRMEDFMELYISWEIDTRETRELPFYGTGAAEEE